MVDLAKQFNQKIMKEAKILKSVVLQKNLMLLLILEMTTPVQEGCHALKMDLVAKVTSLPSESPLVRTKLLVNA